MPLRDIFRRSLFNLRTLFLQNWHLKLIAIALSALLWVYVVADQSSEISVTVAVRVEAPLNLYPSVGTQQSVQVVLKGPRYVLERVSRRKDLALTISMNTASPGLYLRAITPSMIDDLLQPIRSLEVVKIDPSEVTISLEPRVSRMLPVRPIIKEGSLPKGYRIEGAPEVVPSAVMVEGPKSQVDVLDAIETEKIILHDGEQEYSARLQNRDYLTIQSAGNVMVRLKISSIEEEKEITGVEIQVPEGLVAEPSTISVTLQGPVAVLEKLNAKSIAVKAPYPSGTKEVLSSLVPLVTAPDSTTIIRITPSEISVGPPELIKKKTMETSIGFKQK